MIVQTGEKKVYSSKVTRFWKDGSKDTSKCSGIVDKDIYMDCIKNAVWINDLENVVIKVSYKIIPIMTEFSPCGQGYGGMYA